MEISRQDFLKGSLAGVATLAAGSLLGTAAFADDAAPATEEEDWLGQAPEIADSEITEIIETDVVVIGAGVAGCAATRSAAEAGAKVVLIEKADAPQGRGEDYAVINGDLQARLGREVVDADEMVDRLMKDFLYRAKRPILKRWADESAAAFDWFISSKEDLYIGETTLADIPDEHADNFMVPHRHPKPAPYDMSRELFPIYPVTMYFPQGQNKMLPYQLKKAEDTGNVTTYFGHFARKLIREEGGRVTGVIFQTQDGAYLQVNASKGVILATGDYENNTAILKHFCPQVVDNGTAILWTNKDVNGEPTNTGDGLKMGAWIGAKIQQNHAPMIHHMGGTMGIAPFLLLDENGKRFCNEDCPGQQLENQIELIKDFTCYQIWDGNWKDQLEYMPASHGVACYYSEVQPKNNTGNRNYVSQQKLDDAVAGGSTFMGETLEELLDQLDIDKEAALASIERYNELAHNGDDEDFNKASWRLFPIEEGPFYASKFGKARMLVCVGGLESDENCHVFDEDRNIIPGLYVAGNMQGNRFAVEYLTTVPGISHSMALTYGKIAGENAVNGI